MTQPKRPPINAGTLLGYLRSIREEGNRSGWVGMSELRNVRCISTGQAGLNMVHDQIAAGNIEARGGTVDPQWRGKFEVRYKSSNPQEIKP